MVSAGLIRAWVVIGQVDLLGLDGEVLCGLRRFHRSRWRRDWALCDALLEGFAALVRAEVQVLVCHRYCTVGLVLALEHRWEGTHWELVAVAHNEDRSAAGEVVATAAAFDPSHEDRTALVQPQHLGHERASIRRELAQYHTEVHDSLDDPDCPLA